MVMKHLTTGTVQPALVPGKLRVYGMRFCPFTQRIVMALEHNDIPYDIVYINLKNKPEWFLKKSPLGTTPAIEIKTGETLYDSTIIADYLNELYPEKKMFPVDPFMKAHDKVMMELVSRIMTNMNELWIEENKEVFERFLTHLEEIHFELKKRGKVFFGGDKPGMLDFFFWPIFERFEVLRTIRGDKYTIPHDRFVHLFKWGTAMMMERSVKVWFLETEVHTRFMKTKLAGSPDYDFLFY